MINFSFNKKKKSITIKEFFLNIKEKLGIRLVSGKSGLDRIVDTNEVHYPALALTGFLDHFQFKKIQLIGEMEWYYMNSLTPSKRKSAITRLFEFPIPAVIVTSGRRIHKELIACSQKYKVPLYSSDKHADTVAARISEYLEIIFAPKLTMHASLVDVHGIGLLYSGKSGIGKSECVLDLVARGHRLVADDIVTIIRKGDNIMGQGSRLLAHNMEIRGVGIIDIQSLFGIRSIRTQKNIEIMVELVEWDPKMNYERIGLKENKTELLGVEIEKVTVPIFPGKNITVISEVIAMNKLLKMNGIRSANAFNQRLINTIMNKNRSKKDKN